MNSQRLKDDFTEIDEDSNDLDLDSFSDFTESTDVQQISRYTARRKIENLKEEQQLRKNIESFDDWD